MRFCLFPVAILGFVACASQGQVADNPPSVEAVLSQVRTALNVADFPADHPGLKANGKTNRYGVEADAELIVDGRGRFRTSSSGVLGEVHTFDGIDVWGIDWTGAARRLALQDRDMTRMSAYLCTSFWAVKPELFDLAIAADKCTDKEAVMIVKLKDGVFKVNVTLDRATWLPTRADGMVRDQAYAFAFEQFAASPGMKLPRRWIRTARGTTVDTRYDRVEKAIEMTADTFRLTKRGSTDAAFDAKKSGVITVKKAKTGHLLVKPTVAGVDEGWFILDSGAGFTCFDKKLVQKLSMERIGEVPVGGAVASGGKSAIVRATSLEIGPVTLPKPLAVELDLQLIGFALGEKLSGIIGYPLFQAAIVDIDCAKPAVTLNDPNDFELPNGAKWQKLVIDNFHPIVEARYEGDRTGWFLLDTGATDALTFYSPAVRKYKLLEGRTTGMTLQGGLGGMARAKTGTLDWFELGGHRFEKPSVAFSESDKGAFANEYADGNLGQAFFSPFRLVFHFGGERLAFVKKAAE